MGDMKTPDFDDLLAAFDIPDIDAKEAIQSAPEEMEGHQVLGKTGDTGAPSLRPPSPLDPQGLPPSGQGDTSIVSVIVKNRVRSDSSGGAELEHSKESLANSPGAGASGAAGAGGRTEAGGVLMGSRLGPRMPGLVLSQPPSHNSFGTTAMSQSQSNGEIWPPCSPKTASEGGALGVRTARRDSNVLDRPKPLMSPGDPLGKGSKIGLLQQESSPLGADPGKAPGSFAASPFAASAPHVSGVSPGLSSSFFTPSKPMPQASSSPSSLPASLHLSHPAMYPSPPLRASQGLNGTQQSASAVFRRLESDEEDSEPDFGSPLVIQESIESPVCSPPKLSHYHRSPPKVLLSTSPRLVPPVPTSNKVGVMPGPGSPSPPPFPPAPSLPAASSPGQEDRNPEHVKEERDSPESPEPETPNSTAPTCSQPAAPTLKGDSGPGSSSEGKNRDRESLSIKKEEDGELEEGKADGSAEDKTCVGDLGGEVTKKEVVKMEVQDQAEVAAVLGRPLVEGSTLLSRPLKVRIKTIKTSSGGITRTVTRVAAKGAPQSGRGQAAGRAVATRQRKADVDGSQPIPAKSSLLPVSTLQDASSAMLVAASKAQTKLATVASERAKASGAKAAISCTSGTATPSKFTMGIGGVAVRPTAQKAVNGAAAPAGGQQMSKPASIVSGTGTVISRSQSSLVEAFNKILNSKNLLPSYRPDLSSPPPAEWSLPLPSSGYRCLECGDAFALERSLARHYDRRSLRIEVTCNHCAKRLAFFNKCSLLLHAREHKESGLVMQCSHLLMRPIPIEQMVGQQDTTPIGVLSPVAPSTAGAAGSIVPSTLKEGPATQPNPPRRAPEGPLAPLPLPCPKAEPLQYHGFKCPECHSQFAGAAELAAHFQEVKAESSTTCTLCSPAMMLPNGCSAAAHQRIHKHRAPHVCPECGGSARQASFQTHLDEACMHFARRIGYRCSSCLIVFGGLNSIKTHIQVAHCEVFHKCPNCPMAFKSSAGASSHISSQHPSLGSLQAKMIYKCVMCDTVFTQKPLLYVHFDTHLAKQKVHVFKCPDCTKLYAQKSSMMEHIKTTHRGLSVKQEAPASSVPPTTNPESSDGEDWAGDPEDGEEEGMDGEAGEQGPDEAPSSPEAGLGPSAQSASLEWTCTQCGAHCAEREDYVSHMRKEHGKAMKKFPCRMCERSFCSAPSLRRHVRVNHEGIKRVFHCQYCTEGKRTFSSRVILENHIRVRHGVRSRNDQRPELSRKRLAPGASTAEANGNSSEQEAELARMGEETEASRSAGGGEEDSGEDGRPVKRLRGPEEVPSDGRFHCVPCGFSTEDQHEFQQHIPQHRTEAGAQCSQCGACFASASSLSRHCFISHRVRTAPGPGDRSPSPSGQDEDSEGNLGCRVCGRHFDKASDLNTHFRTHGMAFIAAHKTDKLV
ncbi:zinc finger protein 687b-like [Brienomyrus brachyistius]|uniref:zinc finger protein 687b-like n=1 Tax=Brienomyrus brachyistius TaxID=42636 RepID=UPI0020B3B917|nr:zinc finger protein 687b-like [Brienomyrus brachyistius]XP_048848419.1 zinc finger protein 687b-like [Brienomyrus brachyistius]